VKTGLCIEGVNAAVFDIGNVLVDFDFGPFYAEVASKCTIGGDTALDAALEPLKQAYENGRIGRQEFVCRSIEILGYRGTEKEFQSAWENIFTLNPRMETVVQSLSARVPLFLLSNTNDLHREFLFRQFPVFSLFRGGVYSDEARVSKPDPEIFRITRERFGLDPGQTLFVDDLGANVEAARVAGFQVFKYSSLAHADFLNWLEGGKSV
jgi:HAD superfamily hydrolase (TIGR01509 family)